jgi:hypothetical protein
MTNTKQTSEVLRKIRETANALRRQRPRPNLAGYYLQLLGEPYNEEVRFFLRLSLRDEYVMVGDFDAATAIALEHIAKRPDHPMPLLSLVGQKHHHEGNPQAAFPLALQAVTLADNMREFRRHARAMLLRVAADLGDLQTVRTCMLEIIDMKSAAGEPDIRREADLLELARRVGVEEHVLEQYWAFLMPQAE